MAILAYQAFISFTIIVAGLVAKKHLVVICLAWTAFTFLNVLFAPLFILQLITIWGCFALFSSGESPRQSTTHAPSREAVDKSTTDSDVTKQIAKAASDAAKHIAKAANAFNHALDDCDDYLRIQKEVQIATSELKYVIVKERIFIESTMDSSKRTIGIQKRLEGDERLSQLYYEELSKLEETTTNSLNPGGGDRLSSPELPIFDSPPANTKVNHAISEKIKLLKTERDSFLSEIAKTLEEDHKLSKQFVANLREQGAYDIYRRIYPARMTSITASATATRVAAFSAVSTTANSQPRLDTLTSGLDMLNQYVQEARAEQIARALAARGIDPRTSAVIKAQSEALKIPFLVHFTKAENLCSILEHGLCSLLALREKGISPHVNDHRRYDGHSNAICLSIAHPNDKMFFKYRMEAPDQEWAIVVLHASILCSLDTAFCQHNAADRRMSRISLEQRKTVSAFEAMFIQSDDLPSREAQCLKPFDPTDTQAEILVFGKISPELISSVVFDSARTAEKYKDCIGEKRMSIHEGSGFFAARSYVRKSGWNY